MSDSTYDYVNSSQQQTAFTMYGKIVDKKQLSLLTKVFLTSGIGFLFICGIGYLVYYILQNMQAVSAADNVNILTTVSAIGLFVVSILSFYFAFRMTKVSTAFAAVFYSLFVIFQGIFFGLLFYAVSLYGDYSYLKDLILSFAVAGLIFLCMTIWGIRMKNSTANKLSQLIITMFFAIIISNLLVFLLSFFWFNSGVSYWWIDMIISSLSSIVFCLYVPLMIKRIVQMDEFNLSQSNPKLATNIMFYFSYMMVSIFIQIAFIIFRLLVSLRRN